MLTVGAGGHGDGGAGAGGSGSGGEGPRDIEKKDRKKKTEASMKARTQGDPPAEEVSTPRGKRTLMRRTGNGPRPMPNLKLPAADIQLACRQGLEAIAATLSWPNTPFRRPSKATVEDQAPPPAPAPAPAPAPGCCSGPQGALGITDDEEKPEADRVTLAALGPAPRVYDPLAPPYTPGSAYWQKRIREEAEAYSTYLQQAGVLKDHDILTHELVRSRMAVEDAIMGEEVVDAEEPGPAEKPAQEKAPDS